jgi:hypothetical protein
MKNKSITPHSLSSRDLQRERQRRGEDFQAEIRRSWRLVPNCWRMRIADGRGGSRPADEITLLEEINVLAELKRTQGSSFKLNMLRPNQIQGLIDFDEVISRNYGLVFVSFLDEKKDLDEAYAFRLITALKHMKKKGAVNVKLEELRKGKLPAVRLPLLDWAERTYDLKGVVECYKSL